MQKASLKDQILIGLTLFSMFFGAGNLIFPAFLGAAAGTNAVPAFLGFALSAVGLPILGVIAVARSGGLAQLAGRAGKPFAAVFTMLIYLSIGPCLAIPRTASTSFEMAVTPFLPAGVSVRLPSVLYSAVFFAVALVLALRPSKLVDWLGKRLAPVLLLLIAVLFAGCLVGGLAGAEAVSPAYASLPAAQGFVDGYQTMDAIAALIFGIILAMNIRARGIQEEASVLRVTVRAGGIAAVLFLAVYGILVFIGRSGSTLTAENGAQLLSAVARKLFGPAGGVILAAIFVIACLNTCVGLICCCAEYFHKLLPRVAYPVWACVFAAVSAVIANAGLNAILKLSVPVLSCLYPVAIVLILLAFVPLSAKRYPLLYPLTVAAAGAVGLVSALDGVGLVLPGVTALFAKLPLYGVGLGWLLPVLAAAIVGVCVKKKEKTA